jgi:hypothetical protein
MASALLNFDEALDVQMLENVMFAVHNPQTPPQEVRIADGHRFSAKEASACPGRNPRLQQFLQMTPDAIPMFWHILLYPTWSKHTTFFLTTNILASAAKTA